MAEKQFARSGGNSPEFFADDDPLAELARIVGFEPKPVAANTQRRDPPVSGVRPIEVLRDNDAAPVASQPQHPIFNLEDELLREFELYDAPRADSPVVDDETPPLDVAAADLADAAAATVEPDAVPDYDFGLSAVDPEPTVDPVTSAVGAGPAVEERTVETLDAPVEDDDFAGMFGGDGAGTAASDVSNLTEEPIRHGQAGDVPVFEEPTTLDVAGDEPATAAVDVDQPSLGAFDDMPVEHDAFSQEQEVPAHDMAEWPSVAFDAVPADEPAAALEIEAAEPLSSAEGPAEQPFTESLESVERFDLADELEMSLVQSPVAVEEPAARPVVDTARTVIGSDSRFHLPTTNFSVQRSNYRAEPRLDMGPALDARAGAAIVPEPVVAFDALAEDAAFTADPAPEDAVETPKATVEPLSLATPEPEIAVEAAPIAWDSAPADEVSAEPEVAEPQVAVAPVRRDQTAVFNIDDLLADVARYPVPERKSVPIFDTGDLDRSEPAAAVSAPQAEAVAAQPSDRRVEAAPVARKPDPSFDDPFAGQDFDFDFDNIELELADMSVDEPEPVTATPEPVRKVEPAAVATFAQPVRSMATPVQTVASQPVFEPPVVARRPEPRPEPDSDVELQFDPTLITDADENPESIADMDVPALPPVEPEVKVAHPPEYDIDIDAEMANLFNPLTTVSPQKKGVSAESADFANPAWAVAAEPAKAETAGKTAFDEFDEFERALEEDFRRTLVEPFGEDNAAARMTIGPGGYITAEPRRRSSRGLMVGVSLLLVLGIGGAAAGYTYYVGMDGAASTQATGPRVIVADKEPIKVEPVDRGGKTVPNQDKAVYDRVAGNTDVDPKQDSLLSSKEEPVDVVQRTLVPEALPLDRGEDANAIAQTPVGETEDVRLLANDGQAADATAEADTTAGVSPRKVRTMIVKSDGTLVAREASADDATTNPVTETDTTPALAVPTTTQRSANLAVPAFPAGAAADVTDNAVPATATTEAVPTTDLRGSEAATETAVATPTQPVETAVVPTDDAADTADDQADPPVRVVKTTKVEDNAPIPESRPVDQPVNIVGTVTDQGTVRDTTTVTTTAEPATTTTRTEVAALAPGGYVMQIASLPSEADAKRSYANLSSKFGGIIAGRGVDIKKAEISGKGTFYRVRIPVGSKDEAAALCVKYRAAGGTCLISK